MEISGQKQQSKSGRRVSAMSSAVFWWWCVSLIYCHLSLTAATEEEAPPASAQEALGLLASLQQASEGSSNELRKMANMYELLQLAALQQQQQRQRVAELEEGVGEGEEFPASLPYQGRLPLLALQDKEEYFKDKRGSYMSLCHFKICNMGRKRNSYAWGRN
uniref:Uncharacterized protein n=1 Tax=Graphocephala atropunctata TaxID=36148 RepID=A0A1B6KGG9_9HEMI